MNQPSILLEDRLLMTTTGSRPTLHTRIKYCIMHIHEQQLIKLSHFLVMISKQYHQYYQVMMNNPGLKFLTILFLLIPAASALSFNFTSFSTNNTDIIYEGRTTLASNYIQLTPGLTNTIGRATYAQPLHLWDNSSRNLTDFTTHFSFVINSLNVTNHQDGFTFFLVPNGSIFRERAMTGSLGLPGEFSNSSDNHWVAVEFDIFPNVGVDPPYVHVGIDVNAVSSVTSAQWFNGDGILEGREQEAWINYDSQSRNLSVRFTGFENGSSITRSLFHVVDLRDYLPELVNFGFSASTGGATAIQNINSWSFSSNLQINVRETNSTRPNGTGNSNTAIVIGLAVGVPVLVLALGVLAFILWMWRKGTINKADEMIDEFENGSMSKKFAYDELKAATDNFSKQHKLGEGGFGSVYKGLLKSSKSYVAVKKISSNSKQGINEFASEVKIISTLRHRNLVQLLGWCYERKELLLVYEFMPNGSLDFHLFKGKSLLSWATRFRIVNGLASALLYLHEEWEQYVVHRDIKASNIMLDANFNAKLGDFGLAKLVDHEIQSQTTFPVGTWGYMAPEYMINWRASKETDVFSFGIVALEIATGQKSRHIKPDGNAQDLAEHVWSLHRMEKLLDAADPQLNSDFNSQEMEQLLCVGLWCAHPNRNLRPSIREVIRVLQFEAHVPVLPVPEDLFSSSYESSDVSKTN